jgi:hypothetical protein
MALVDIEGVCPHCGGAIVVAPQDVACAIFRHAVFKESGEPIPPHAPKEECERLVAAGLVYGCAGPLRLAGAGFVACDYI